MHVSATARLEMTGLRPVGEPHQVRDMIEHDCGADAVLRRHVRIEADLHVSASKRQYPVVIAGTTGYFYIFPATRAEKAKLSGSAINLDTEDVIQLGAKADGWVKGESSPVIAHIVNKEEKVDYYHAYDANEPHALDVPAEGEYEVSFISPVDKDGSIYEVPKTAKVKSEAEDKDGKDTGDELPFEFKPIAADKADADALNAIVKSVGDAVKKGDETLTGANGTKVIELVKENAKANPNADKDKVDEESQKAEEGVTDEPSGGNAGASKPETGGNSTSSGNGGSTGSNGGSGSSNNGGGSKPQHTHNWVPQTTVVHHDAQYQTIHHDAVYGTRVTCNQCHADLTNQDVFAHFEESFLNGGSCESYSTVDYQISPAWDEQVLVSDAWDETVTTGYKCSGCPATK